MKKFIPYLFIVLLTVVFFWQFIFKGLLPIPADTIVGLYHPFRDVYAKAYPNGIPFKNFLITDPVRQLYPWKELVISSWKKFQAPLWNPYSFSGTPLLANFQSGAFYPLNLLFFVMPFASAWSITIILSMLLTGIFTFLYLDNLKINKWASLLGAVSFSFSGFFIAWLEWGNIVHTALWLPLILLSIDKFTSSITYKVASIWDKKIIFWSLTYLFALTSSFFAGHLQIFFYLWVFSFIYFSARWFQYDRKGIVLIPYIILNTSFLILTSIQWIPTLQFIMLSARGTDVSAMNNAGWFIPWQHFIQFIAPDYFGNPSTMNYWGVWNYAEFIGYVGMAPLVLAVFALFNRKDKKTLFFGTFLFLAIFFAFPTFLAKLPFVLKIPLLDTAQPTRLIFIIDFLLAVLSALGFDYLLKKSNKIPIFFSMFFVFLVLIGLWFLIPNQHAQVVKNNLILPSMLFAISCIILTALVLLRNYKKIVFGLCLVLLTIISLDLLRFGWKFATFSKNEYLFPQARTIEFLQNNIGNNRFMTIDSRILPPNFSSVYKLQSVEGYDPLYLKRYAEIIAASERMSPDINPPFGFNRIITPNNYQSKIINLLGVKYILSLSELNSNSLKRVFQEGETIVYENLSVAPRTFFVNKVELANDKHETIEGMFSNSFLPEATAIVEDFDNNLIPIKEYSKGTAKISSYSENKVIVETANEGQGFLILTDSYYPSWKATIDGKETKIFRADYHFRGVIVPSGRHKVEYYVAIF